MAATDSHLFAAALCALTLCAFTTQAKSTAVDQPQQGKGQNCLTRFRKYPDEFSNCTSRICFLFLEQKPYVQLDPSMTSEEHEVLFPCNAPSSKFPFLSGTVFSIHNATSVKDALCVWAGNACTFNDITAFLSDQSELNPNHQFAISGLLLEASSRVTSTMYPSSSIVDTRLVIIGPLEEYEGSSSPMRILLRPFRREAWVLFSAMIAIFFALGLLITFVFTPEPIRWHSLFFQFLGDPVDEEAITAKLGRHAVTANGANSANTASPRRRELSRNSNACEMGLLSEDSHVQVSMRDKAAYRAALLLFRAALSIFLVLFFLFYEIAVVNFLFIQNTKPVAKNISRLSARELSKYSVLRESTLEGVWRKTVDRYGLYNSSTYPWYRCSTADDCFDKVLDRAHPAKLVVTFEIDGNYQMLKRGACNKLTIYKTERRLYSFGAGWLYGKGVKLPTRRRINKDILDLRVTDKMRQLMSNHLGRSGETTCSPRPSNIGVSIVGLAGLFLVGPSLALVAVILCISGHKHSS